ncbi:hypothetical protein [Agromyces italicus]|uniref:hypothetical protein n=1 Tax=Agromyces italicus TaxID=279572 RepID=UPI0012F7C0E6|nr:hypothetical protein [Agromyces italicus]
MSDWGSDLEPAALPAAALAEGYDGVELWWPSGRRTQGELADAAASAGAVLALLVTSPAEDPRAHADEIERRIIEIDGSGLPVEHLTPPRARPLDGRAVVDPARSNRWVAQEVRRRV